MISKMFTKGLKLALVAALSVTTLTASAQKSKKSNSGNAPFEKGDKTIGVFMGLGVDYGYYGTTSPTFGVLYDQGIINDVGPGNIGIGGVLAVKTAHYNYSGGYKATWVNYFVGVRGTYHLTLLKDKVSKLDPYGGVTIGLRIVDYNDSYYDKYGNSPYHYNTVNPFAGLFVGAKYNFTENFGAFSELGYDISFFRLGINFNF